MYRPSIKSTPTLVLLAVISLVLYIVSEYSRVEVRAPYYEEKVAASKTMRQAMGVILEHRAAKIIVNENLGDPLTAVLIGQKYSATTTEEGLLASKITALNPNFAAAVVEMLKQAGVQKDDKVAVAMSGSFPGLNLAVFSACQVLGVEPLIITSLGSSSWGANEEDFTWLDIETLLWNKGLFRFKSSAATLGGGNDDGFGLSQLGISLLKDAAMRNGVALLEEKDLNVNIKRRLDIYGNIEQYKAYINVGGGIASLGHPANSDIIDSGFNYRLLPKNYPGFGVINHFGSKIPVIHLANIDRLIRLYKLPLAPNPLPEAGTGAIFFKEKYDLRVTIASLVIIAFMLGAVFRLDKKLFKISDQGTDPENLL